MKFDTLLSAALIAAAVIVAPAGKTFKWSSASDIPTLDIHSLRTTRSAMACMPPSDSLVYYNSRTFARGAARHGLEEISPQVRFTLRTGSSSVMAPFTADDVVFSIARAMAKTSNFAKSTQGIDKVVKVNDNTVDFIMKGPNPVLLNQLTELRIMSKAWSRRTSRSSREGHPHQDETFSHRNAPWARAPTVKMIPRPGLVLVKNPNYWGKRANQRDRNRLHADQGRKPRAWRRCCLAKSTSCSTRARKICRDCATTPTSR